MTNWTDPTATTTSWTSVATSDPGVTAYKLLIDSANYLLIDSTNHLLIQSAVSGTEWSEDNAN